MKTLLLALLVAACPFALLAQSSAEKSLLPSHPNAPASEQIPTEKIEAPQQAPPVASTQTNAPGRQELEQVKALAHKIWLAQFRLNDLLAQVHPEKWKMPPAARESFDQSLKSLHQALADEEDWRSHFEARPDSVYLGFQTYVGISALLPRVDGVAHSVSQYEDASFGAQYSQAANQLFDLQQSLEPYLASLLKNQDNVMLTAQTNVAACENQLSYAMHGKQERAVPMKNIAPDFKGRRRTAHAGATAGNSKQAAEKSASAPKPAANPPKKEPAK